MNRIEMKIKSLCLLMAVLFLVPVFGQEEATVEKEEKKEKAEKVKRKAQDRLVTEIFFAQLTDKPGGLKAKIFSRGINMYFTYDVPLGKSPISIAPGFGFGKSIYALNQRINYTDSTNTTSFANYADTTSVKRNNLNLTYIDIPLELRYRSKPNKNDKSWKLAVGFKFGVNVGSKWRYKGDEFRKGAPFSIVDQEGVAFREHKVPNIEKFRYGVTMRGGYGPINLFMYYSISTLFSDTNGSGMHPIHIGLSLTGL